MYLVAGCAQRRDMQRRAKTGRQGRAGQGKTDRFKLALVQPSKTKITRGISGPGRAKITGRNQGHPNVKF